MTVPPPRGPAEQPPTKKKTQPPSEEELETARRNGRFLGWVILALIVAYGSTQLPLPFKLLSPAAGLAGVILAVILLVRVIRRRSGVLLIFSSSLGLIGCGMFFLMGSLQAVFWADTAAYDQCMSTAVTDRSVELCAEDLEESMISRIPGGSSFQP